MQSVAAWPDGHAVTNPLPEDSVMTTFIVTAATPDVGTPPRPATFNETVSPWPGLAPLYPICSGPGTGIQDPLLGVDGADRNGRCARSALDPQIGSLAGAVVACRGVQERRVGHHEAR